ncbi:MAG: RecBCD enzyme subunit [Pseudomonadota bacterium]|jgi:exodeoxyribonuclease V gamma subunit
MLHLHLSNRAERLQDALIARLDGPRTDPLRPEALIVPSAAVQRALTLALARRHGVCAGVGFSYLAPWLWQQARALRPELPEDSPLAADALPWRLWQLFQQVPADGQATAEGRRGPSDGAPADDLAAEAGAHPRLRRYLLQADASMRLDLAQRLARLYDQYGAFRPEWLEDWAVGRQPRELRDEPDADWQAALYRALLAQALPQARPPAADRTGPGRDTGSGAAGTGIPAWDDSAAWCSAPSRHQALARLTAALRGMDDATLRHRLATAQLPATVHLHLLPAIPPLHLALLQQLARGIDIHLDLLNPCEAEWFDLVDEQRLMRLLQRGAADHAETGHGLLTAWGRSAQGQLRSLLFDLAPGQAVETEDYAPLDEPTLLAGLHDSVLRLQDLVPGSLQLRPGDRSIELHDAHSLSRQLEVLQERLLGLLGGPDAPPLDRIVVLLPDLQAATPLIDAVFGTAPPERFLPYTITGRALSSVNAPARALMDALALVDSRWPASALMALLQQPVVARRHGLDTEDLAVLHDALREAGAHWGLDAEQQRALGLPGEARHTLGRALERLFLGHALPRLAGAPLAGLLPAGDAESGRAHALGALWRCVQLLSRLRQRCSRPLSAARWHALLGELLEALVEPDPQQPGELDALRELQQLLADLAAQWQRAGLQAKLPLPVVRQALQGLLDAAVRGGVPTGTLTFSAYSSLRGLPCDVLCMLGLDDGVFPANPRPEEFDLLAHAPRAGDRVRRDDDRQLFLDLILSARRVLHLSHTGRSLRDNAPLPPSVLVTELMEALATGLGDRQAAARLTLRHPLQAFDPSLFDPASDPRLRSHRADLAAALDQADSARRALQAAAVSSAAAGPVTATAPDAPDGDGDADTADEDPPPAAGLPPFFSAPLPAPEPAWHQISLGQLVEFARNPARTLLRRRLGLSLPDADEELADDEPFVPDSRARNALARRLLPALLDGREGPALQQLAEAGIELPAGSLGAEALEAELRGLEQMAAELRTWRAEPAAPPATLRLDVAQDAQVWRLEGDLGDLRPSGLLRHRSGRLGAADRVEAWLHHLVLCAAAPVGVQPGTRWLGRGGEARFAPCPPEQARAHLATWVLLYAQGLRAPVPWLPRSAWAWAQPPRQFSRARAVWCGRTGITGERDDPWNALVWRGLPDPCTEDTLTFETLSARLLDPLLDHLIGDLP